MVLGLVCRAGCEKVMNKLENVNSSGEINNPVPVKEQ
jgi:hypothetical protein